MFSPTDYLDFTKTEHSALFEGVQQVWEVIPRIADYLKKNLKPGIHGELKGTPFIGDQVYIAPGAIVEPGAYIIGPAWIGEGAVVRHGAYVRENVIAGRGVTLGNSSEFKNCILFDQAEVPHFSYVGDSILGYKAHLGAGVILSNLKLDRTNIHIRHDGQVFDTGLRKFGAVIGDRTEIGCNSVMNPGTILGRDCILYPGTMWKGVLDHSSIAKTDAPLKVIPRRNVNS